MDDLTIGAHVPEPFGQFVSSADISGLPPADVPHYLYGLVRLELLKKGLFPVHAACVGGGGRYGLIAGHSGDGKTTVAMKLVADGGCMLFSGNKTVVDLSKPGKIIAVGGTRTVTTKDATGLRKSFRLEEGQYETSSRVEISAIFRIRLNDGHDRAALMPELSALHALYPFFLDAVNADVILDGGGRVLSGEPPAGTRERLARGLAAALKAVPAYEVTGSSAFVASEIAKLL
jgi:hypothetical protein